MAMRLSNEVEKERVQICEGRGNKLESNGCKERRMWGKMMRHNVAQNTEQNTPKDTRSDKSPPNAPPRLPNQHPEGSHTAGGLDRKSVV